MQGIKERLSEEIKNSGMTTVEIAKKLGVSPEMVTQYKTTKKNAEAVYFCKIMRNTGRFGRRNSGHKQ